MRHETPLRLTSTLSTRYKEHMLTPHRLEQLGFYDPEPAPPELEAWREAVFEERCREAAAAERVIQTGEGE